MNDNITIFAARMDNATGEYHDCSGWAAPNQRLYAADGVAIFVAST